MARVWQLLVRADGDTRAAQREMRKLQRSVRGYGRNLTSFGKSMTLAVTAPVLATTAIGLRELQEQMRVTRQTEAVLKSTGKAGQISAKHVEDLASKFQTLSTIEDDVIQSSQNVLLRFDGINKKNFDRVSRSLVDMMAAGKDGASAATALGIALTAPEKAAGRLARAGIKLSKSEQKRIETLVKHNKMGLAQAVIMRRVEKAYKGQAKALGDTAPIDRIKRMFEDLAESLAVTLLPALLDVGEWFQRAIAWFQKLSPRTKDISVKFALIAAVVGPLVAVLGGAVAGFAALIPVLVAIGAPALAAIAAVGGVVAVLTAAYLKSDRFRSMMNRLLKVIIRNKVVILGFIGPAGILVAVLVKLYQRSNAFRSIVNLVIAVVKTAVTVVAKIVAGFVKFAAAAATAIAKSKTLRATISLVRSVFSLATTPVRAMFSALSSVAGAAVSVAKKLGGSSSFQSALGWIKRNANGAFDGMKSALSSIDSIAGTVITKIERLISKIETAIRKARDLVTFDIPGVGKSAVGMRAPSAVTTNSYSSAPVVNVYPQSQDVEAIARRVAFMLANGRVSAAGGMA